MHNPERNDNMKTTTIRALSFASHFLLAFVVVSALMTPAVGIASEPIHTPHQSPKERIERDEDDNDNEQVVRGRSIILIDSRSDKTEELLTYITNELEKRYGMTVEHVAGNAGSVTLVGLGKSIGKIELWDNESFSVIPSSREVIVPAAKDGPEVRKLFWLALSLVADEVALPRQDGAPSRHYLALSLEDAMTGCADGVLCKSDVKAILQAVAPVFVGLIPNPEETFKKTMKQLTDLAEKGNPKAQYMLAMVAIRNGNLGKAKTLLRSAADRGNEQAAQALKLIEMKQRESGKDTPRRKTP